MGIHYVHIDSHNKATHETDSKMTVYLNPPLHNVHSVQVKSFSIANEIYNIQANNNELELIIFKYTTVPPAAGALPSVTSHTKVTVKFPAGVYTTQELIDFFNADIIEAKHTSNRSNVTLSMELLGNNKVQLIGTSPTTQYRHMIIYYPYEAKFKTSVAHRLGFSREQVVGAPMTPIFEMNDLITRFNSPTISFMVYNPNGNIVFEDEAMFLLWKPSSSTISEQVGVSNNIGFDTYPFIYIVSNELSKHSSKTLRTDGQAITIPCNTLQKVSIDRNLYSWVHMLGHESVDQHVVDGRTIHHFDIGIADNIGTLFESSHYKDFTLELQFETIDNLEERNAQLIEQMTKQSFLSRHAK